jgi:F-type H+-transporting ATPase subunit b
MESVLASLGALLLRALPTFFLVLLLHFYLKAIFFKPLEAALKERKAATSGVRKLAEEAIANAERKAAEYEAALRAARSELYKEQEAMRAKWREDQTAAVAQMRRQVEAQVAEARRRIQREQQEARASLESRSEALAEEIARAILSGRPA